jgi:hypothetical protein
MRVLHHDPHQPIGAVIRSPAPGPAASETPFVLHFRSLYHAGRDFAFPCDGQGNVDLNEMTDRIRNNYLYARAMIGRELSWPSVHRIS